MKTPHLFTSACRYCRYYNPEGRRGGTCQQLGVPVQAGWKACTLALPPFAPSWENLEDIVFLENALSLDYFQNCQMTSPNTQEVNSKKQTANA